MPDRLSINETLPAGSDLTSPNGQHRASMQTDGNFVISRRDGTPKWATGTDGRAIGDIVMQDDGNLVMYDANGPVWASGTDQHPGAVLVLQDDGNLVIYAPDGTPLWATGTNITMMRVAGFQPGTNGFRFQNAFDHAPDIQINLLGLNVAIGKHKPRRAEPKRHPVSSDCAGEHSRGGGLRRVPFVDTCSDGLGGGA